MKPIHDFIMNVPNKPFGLILSGGAAPSYTIISRYIETASWIIAADSGYDAYPDIQHKISMVLGDMDSISPDSLGKKIPQGKTKIFPAKKDFSDTELCIQYCIEMGISEIHLVGGGEGRLDHTLNNLQLFSKYKVLTSWITAHETVFPLCNGTIITDKKGLDISFYCLSEDARIKSSGLEWNLDSFELNRLNMSLSNKCVSEIVKLKVTKGNVLAILSHGDLESQKSQNDRNIL